MKGLAVCIFCRDRQQAAFSETLGHSLGKPLQFRFDVSVGQRIFETGRKIVAIDRIADPFERLPGRWREGRDVDGDLETDCPLLRFMLSLCFGPSGKIALEVSRQGRRVDKRRVARGPFVRSGEEAGLAFERSKPFRLCCDLRKRALRSFRIFQHGIDIDRLERGLRLGEDLGKACRDLLPLLLQTGIGD